MPADGQPGYHQVLVGDETKQAGGEGRQRPSETTRLDDPKIAAWVYHYSCSVMAKTTWKLDEFGTRSRAGPAMQSHSSHHIFSNCRHLCHHLPPVSAELCGSSPLRIA